MQIDLKLLAVIGLSTSVYPVLNAQSEKSARPNIIYIMSDDHAYQAISAYGGALKDFAPTPNSTA
jgi:hypothetical protein